MAISHPDKRHNIVSIPRSIHDLPGLKYAQKSSYSPKGNLILPGLEYRINDKKH
jgi:hypothetical protein